MRYFTKSKVKFKCFEITEKYQPPLSLNVKYTYEHLQMAILVSDLSGFTSTTREWGIVHFASVIVRMRQLCLPIFKHHGAAHIGTEADNFIVIFPDTIQAVLAGLEMIKVLKEYAASLTEERKHFQVKLNGIGIHCGKGIVLDKEDLLHGDTFNVAYNIGESLCDGGNLLVSQDVRDILIENDMFNGIQFKQLNSDDINTYEKGIFEVDQATIKP